MWTHSMSLVVNHADNGQRLPMSPRASAAFRRSEIKFEDIAEEV